MSNLFFLIVGLDEHPTLSLTVSEQLEFSYYSLFFPLLLFTEGMKMRSTKQEPNGNVKANKAVSMSSPPRGT